MTKIALTSIVSIFLSISILMISCQNKAETAEKNSDDNTEVITSPIENDVPEDSDSVEVKEEVITEEDNEKEVEVSPKEATQPTSPPKKSPSTIKDESVKKIEKTKDVVTNEPTSNPSNNTSTNQPKVAEAPKQKEVKEKIIPKVVKEVEKKIIKKPFSHDIWDGLLRKYVSGTGVVNYAGFKRDKAKLQQYLDLLADNSPTSSMSKNDQIAYWINAYNAFTVDLIVDNYPISSILKLDGGKTWYVKRITIGGKKYALNDIEKNILIGRFKEARIHFAVNCAAQSCPPLRNRAWKGSSLNSDLDRASKAFIKNNKHNQISKKKAKLSRIFDWYKGDFGNVNTFINKYSNRSITGKTKVSFNEYNWDLNE
ncbi:MAG: DUF547 domain-containing protein [Saprospiraceae bacterium]